MEIQRALVHMKTTLIIWSAIALIVCALLFPAYGYTRFSITVIWKSDKHIDTNEFGVPWTYLRHQFIFSPPRQDDPRLSETHKSHERATLLTPTVNVQIAWSVVAVEIGVIVLVASGLCYTIRERQRSAGSSPP